MFERVVSLGWFCSVALETKRIGLRDGSYPFDWLLTHNFSKVLEILNGEQDNDMILKNEHMLQYKDSASKWYNKKYQISIFHDFDKYKKLESQLDAVNEKYRRRVHRLHECKGETLYIRYIKNRGEAEYIAGHESYIDSIIKKHNTQNRILYIANPECREVLKSSKEKVFYVENDENDYVAREFLKKVPELEAYLLENVQRPKVDYYEINPRRRKKLTEKQAFKKLMEKFRKQAKNDNPIHQDGVLETCDSDEIILFKDKSECSGCGACQALCPKSAIEMKEIKGFYYPFIDQEKCVRCKHCVQVCPFKVT